MLVIFLILVLIGRVPIGF
nr:hypothetical protein [Legionella antarctica]